MTDDDVKEQKPPCRHLNTEDHETFQKCTDCGEIFQGRTATPEAT